GILLAQSSNALGGSTMTVVASGASLQLQQLLTTGSMTVGRNLALIGTGAPGTTGALQMLGAGTGVNTESGTIALLGDTSIGVGTVVNSGATLNINATITGEQITLNGTGFGVLPSGNLLLPRGALVATAGITLTGNIILNTPDATIDALAGQTLTINGNVGV